MRSPNLTWLRSFETAARLLNFTEAGRELGLTQTAISLHIKSLEDTLGCKLFVRRARHLTLSSVGEAYYHLVRDALGSIDVATVSLFGPASRQTLTVRVPISTAALWLAPHLPTFTRANPGINIRLISTIWATSISDEDVDVDIRQGSGGWPGMEAERISEEFVVPIQSATTPVGDGGNSVFLTHPPIQVLGNEDSWRSYLASLGLQELALKPQLVVDTTTVAISLVAAGAGYSVIQERFARYAISAGRGIAIVGEPAPYPQAHYLVSRKTQRPHRPEAELFKDWLREIFSKDATVPQAQHPEIHPPA